MKRGRALLADSHLGMLGGVHSLLGALFETVVMVADERSLVDAITDFKPDLVVVDLSLPGEGEANIARRLLAGRWGAPSPATSGCSARRCSAARSPPGSENATSAC